MSADRQGAFNDAVEHCTEINGRLADTDGQICEMSFAGAIGYHVFVADGETEPEFLWKVALLQALDSAMLDMMHVDADEPSEARRQLEQTLGDYFDRFTAEYVAEEFESNLQSLIDTQAANGGAR